MTDLSPIAGLFYFEQLGWATLKLWTAYLADSPDWSGDVDDEQGTTLTRIATIVGMIDETCSAIGLVSPDAVPPHP